MNIQLNGNDKEISSDTTINDILEELDMANTSVVVVLNQNVLQPEEISETPIKDGDTIEVIRFVGGG